MKSFKTTIAAVIGIAMVIIAAVLSVSFGSKHIGAEDIFKAVINLGKTPETFEQAVIQTRVPRTVFAILAGASLAVSGALMQAVTRNPIADPGILGINTGAALAVVAGLCFMGITKVSQYIVLALIGASVTAVLVYALANFGREKATPLKLALSGAAISTAFSSLISILMIPDNQVMNEFRFWQVGSVGGATWDKIFFYVPFFVVGMVISIIMIPYLNNLALGDEVATGLGVNVSLVRILSAISGVILCGSTTALAGPIAFVGLMVPHVIRNVLGGDLRYVIPFSALYGAVLLPFADVIGRVLHGTGELEVGIITAAIGSPFFIAIVRNTKVKSL